MSKTSDLILKLTEKHLKKPLTLKQVKRFNNYMLSIDHSDNLETLLQLINLGSSILKIYYTFTIRKKPLTPGYFTRNGIRSKQVYQSFKSLREMGLIEFDHKGKGYGSPSFWRLVR